MAFIFVERDEFVGHEGVELVVGGGGIGGGGGGGEKLVFEISDDGGGEDFFVGAGDGGFLFKGSVVEAGEEVEHVLGCVDGGWSGHFALLGSLGKI